MRKHIDEIHSDGEERHKELEAMSDEDIDYSDILLWMKSFSKTLNW